MMFINLYNFGFMKLNLILATLFLYYSTSSAEVISNKQIVNKNFDIWTVSCEDDEMLGNIKCRLFVEIDDFTTLFINPNGKNKILLFSKSLYYGKSVFIKTDNNKMFVSEPVSDGKYGNVIFKKEDIEELYSQMQKSDFLYIRFSVKDNKFIDGFREVTVKFPLAELKETITYYNKQVSKYNYKN